MLLLLASVGKHCSAVCMHLVMGDVTTMSILSSIALFSLHFAANCTHCSSPRRVRRASRFFWSRYCLSTLCVPSACLTICNTRTSRPACCSSSKSDSGWMSNVLGCTFGADCVMILLAFTEVCKILGWRNFCFRDGVNRERVAAANECTGKANTLARHKSARTTPSLMHCGHFAPIPNRPGAESVGPLLP